MTKEEPAQLSEEEKCAVVPLRNGRIINYKNKPVYEFFKRVFDLVVSSLAIVLLSPLFLILAILIRATSDGPAFYISDRVGRNGKVFRFYKFRSMHKGAEQELDQLLHRNEIEGNVTFKMGDDPRVTKFGRFLRRTSLDELPQLFNIFLGNMTFVGPRPCTTREYKLYDEFAKQRQLVKQGLTCLWQCSGRSNTSFEQQVELDFQYIEKRGFWYDLGLIFRTIPAVLRHDGAK